MTTSTIIFDNAKIYKGKMFFTLYGKDSVYTKVFDKNGNNILNRISSYPEKTRMGSYVMVSRKIEYQYDKNIIFKHLKRLYDKTGMLIKSEKSVANKIHLKTMV